MNLESVPTTWAVDEAPFPTIEAFDSSTCDYGFELIWKNGQIYEQALNPLPAPPPQATVHPGKMFVLPNNHYPRTSRTFESMKEHIMQLEEQHHPDAPTKMISISTAASVKSLDSVMGQGGPATEVEGDDEGESIINRKKKKKLKLNGSSSIITKNERRRRRNMIKRNMQRDADEESQLDKLIETIKDLQAKMQVMNAMNHKMMMNSSAFQMPIMINNIMGLQRIIGMTVAARNPIIPNSHDHFLIPNPVMPQPPSWNVCRCPLPRP